MDRWTPVILPLFQSCTPQCSDGPENPADSAALHLGLFYPRFPPPYLYDLESPFSLIFFLSTPCSNPFSFNFILTFKWPFLSLTHLFVASSFFSSLCSAPSLFELSSSKIRISLVSYPKFAKQVSRFRVESPLQVPCCEFSKKPALSGVILPLKVADLFGHRSSKQSR